MAAKIKTIGVLTSGGDAPENLHEPCSRRIKDMEQKYLKTEETNSKQEEVWNRR